MEFNLEPIECPQCGHVTFTFIGNHWQCTRYTCSYMEED